MTAVIHPTAVVHEGASIGPDCEIGPYCIVGPDVKLAKSVRLRSHVVVDGDTRIGEGTEIFPFASIGGVPQDLKFKGRAKPFGDWRPEHDPRKLHHEPRHRGRRDGDGDR